MKRFLPQGEFGKNVLTMLGGAAFAQAIPILASPLLTRLYTPAELGCVALFVAIATVSVVIATGRYELAILLPRSHRAAFDVMMIAVLLAMVTSSVALMAVVALHDDLAQMLPIGTSAHMLHLIPLSVLLMGVSQSLTYWNNRRARYRVLAASRVGQNAMMCGVQIGAGLCASGDPGLVGGYMAGQSMSIAMIVRATRAELASRLRKVRFARLRIVARRYRSFPIFLVPGHVANTVSAQMPVLLLAILYGPAIAGLYSLAERVLVAPTSIIGSAMGDVYRQQAALTYQQIGNCRALFLRTARRLTLIALAPLLVSTLGGPVLIELVFGSPWRGAGELVALLGVMIFFQLISSPLSQTVYLARMQRLDLAWQMLRLALSFASIYGGEALGGGYKLSVGLYAASLSLLHVIHSAMQYRAACGAGPPVPART